MTTTEVIRNVRPDLGGVEERSERLRKDVKKRAEATVDDVMERTEATREQLAALAAEAAEELGERAEAAREALIERYHEIEEELPTEEIATKVQLGGWKAFQSGLGGLLALPGLAVRGLGALSGIADDLSERGSEVSERGKELLGAVPPSKAERRRSQRRTAGVAIGGFLVGVLTGWLLASRNQTMVTYEPTMSASQESEPDAKTMEGSTAWAPVPPATESETPIAPDATSEVADPANPEDPDPHAATSQADVLDVRSEVERPEPGQDA